MQIIKLIIDGNATYKRYAIGDVMYEYVNVENTNNDRPL